MLRNLEQDFSIKQVLIINQINSFNGLSILYTIAFDAVAKQNKSIIYLSKDGIRITKALNLDTRFVVKKILVNRKTVINNIEFIK